MPQFATHDGPEWVVAEMPAGYQTRVLEIQRLAAELDQMGRFARLLWQVGPALEEVLRDAFAALKFETERVDQPVPHVAVRLDAHKRLLLVTSASAAPIQKKDAELSQLFTVVQQGAGDEDRVVLVTNVDAEKRPAERAPALAPDALALLVRMGAVHLHGATVFDLWKLSFDSMPRARDQVAQLHDHEAGTFALPASLLRLAEMKF